jgi:adenylate kinase
MEVGGLVPDHLVLDLVERHLSNTLDDGFVLDGFPRTLAQAQQFMRSRDHPLDRVIELATPDEVVIGRLTARFACSACGGTAPDVDTESCARCAGPMHRREDDDGQVIRARLAAYREQAEPMLDFFRDAGLLTTVDGNRPRYDVSADIWRLVTD